MKKLLSRIVNKISNTYGGMSSNASLMFFFGQAKTPKCLVKKN